MNLNKISSTNALQCEFITVMNGDSIAVLLDSLNAIFITKVIMPATVRYSTWYSRSFVLQNYEKI